MHMLNSFESLCSENILFTEVFLMDSIRRSGDAYRAGGGVGGGALTNVGYTGKGHPTGSSFCFQTIEVGVVFP